MLQKLSLFLVLIISFHCIGQTTYNPSVVSSNNYCTIKSVTLTDNETIVKIWVPKSKYKKARISAATVLVPLGDWDITSMRESGLDLASFPGFGTDTYLNQMMVNKIQEIRQALFDLKERGWLIKNLGAEQLDCLYKPAKGADGLEFTLHFDRVPAGIENLVLREIVRDTGWEWYNIKINNPVPSNLHYSLSEQQLKDNILADYDEITGIYEGISASKYKLACIKDKGVYKLIYISHPSNKIGWHLGDVKAVLHSSSTPSFFKADWYMSDRTKNSNSFAAFKTGVMEIVIDDDKETYLKMFPSATDKPINSSKNETWGGTAFALKDGYLITNYHVVDGANTIDIYGIKGDFSKSYRAMLIAKDMSNDLALLKIEDSLFSGFGIIPYSIKTSIADVGEDIFVLGYPLTSTMGDEIKLTTGIISSKTGFQGDIALYQISAPIQPGNSGGPLFDSRGNLIGIVCAKHADAESVGYAIKSSYLNNLIESVTSSKIIPDQNILSSLTLPNKVKKINNFVFMVKCSSSSNASSKEISLNRMLDQGDGAKLYLTRITLNPNQTILEFNGSNFVWCNIDSKCKIIVDGKSYFLTNAIGIPVSPEKINGQNIKFSLIFPAIPTDSKKLDFIESDSSRWRFYDVDLQ